MENEANACMVAEVWSGRLDGVRNAVVVAISEGHWDGHPGNGQMITGHGGLAGEFGHVMIDPQGRRAGADEGDVGKLCVDRAAMRITG